MGFCFAAYIVSLFVSVKKILDRSDKNGVLSLLLFTLYIKHFELYKFKAARSFNDKSFPPNNKASCKILQSSLHLKSGGCFEAL